MRGARLEIEPCAVVLVGAGRSVRVREGAALDARADESGPVRFDADASQAAAGAWQGVVVDDGAAPSSLDGAVIAHAGGDADERGDEPAALRVASTSLAWGEVTVEDARAVALSLDHGGRLGGQGILRVRRGAELALVRVDDVDSVGSLPSIVVEAARSSDVRIEARQRVVTRDAVWRRLAEGLRYRVRANARVLVGGDASPTLTLAPGVRVAFERGSELAVGWSAAGALRAIGASQAPVVLDAASPGEPWIGVVFGPHTIRAATRLDGVVVGGAGAAGSFRASCVPPVDALRDDQGVLGFLDVDPSGLLGRVRIERGPASGFALLIEGEGRGPAFDVTRSSQTVDLSSAGVRCAQSWARLRGHCVETPRCR